MELQTTIILLLFGYSTAAYQSVLPNGCPADFHVHRLLRHESDCSKFYQCSNGQRILMQCGSPLLFDEELQVCNWADQVRCDLPNGCPSDFSIHLLLPHETDCDKFYSCSNGNKMLQSCPASTLFDFELQGCDWAHNVNCNFQPPTDLPSTDPPTESPIEEPTTDVADLDYLPNGCPADFSIHLLLPHEYDCSKFYSCSNGQKILLTCGSDTLFDKELQVCNWADQVKCDLSNGCPSDFSIHLLLPHETDCDKFYSCSNGYKILQSCPANTLFDFELQTCNWAQEVECTSKIEPTTDDPTSTEPTTVAVDSTTVTVDSTTVAVDSTTVTVDSTTAELEPTTSEPITQEPTPDLSVICAGSVFGNVPHPYNCREYFLCSGQNAILLTCPQNYEFDPNSRICVEIAPGGCTLGPATTSSYYPTTGTSTIEVNSTTAPPTTVPNNVTATEPTTVDVNSTTAAPTTVPNNVTTTEPTTVDVNSTTAAPTTVPNNVTTTKPTTVDVNSTTAAPTTVPNNVTTTKPTTVDVNSTTAAPTTVPNNVTTTEPTTVDVNSTTAAPTTVPNNVTTTEPTTVDVNSTTAAPTTVPNNVTTTEPTTVPNNVTTTETTIVDVNSTTVAPTTTPNNATTTEPTTTEPEVLCPPGFFGNVAHPDRCDLFFLCSLGMAIEISCANGTEFNANRGECVVIAPGGCTLGPIVENLTTTIAPTPELTTLKPTTVEPTTVEATTPEVRPNITDPILPEPGNPPPPIPKPEISEPTPEPPVVEPTTTTKIETTTVAKALCPPGFFGNVQHPNACNMYYLCTGGMEIALSCPSGTEFDVASAQCLQISEHGCTASKGVQ